MFRFLVRECCRATPLGRVLGMHDEQSTSYQEAADVRVPPLLIPLVAIGSGIVLQWLGLTLQMPFADAIISRSIGGFLFLVGLGMNVLAVYEFKQTHQNPSPRTPTPELVMRGPYRISRNPMYLGLGLFQIGLGLLLDNLWVSLLTVPAWITVQYIAILPEEAYLEQRFGDQYRQYRATVRRWI